MSELPKTFAELRKPSLFHDFCQAKSPQSFAEIKEEYEKTFANIETNTESEKIITSTLIAMIRNDIIPEAIDIGCEKNQYNYSFAYLSVYFPNIHLDTLSNWIEQEFEDGEGSDIHVYICSPKYEMDLRKWEKNAGKEIAFDIRRAREQHHNVEKRELTYIMYRYPTDALRLLPEQIADEFTMNYTSLQLMYYVPGQYMIHLTSRFINMIKRFGGKI